MLVTFGENCDICTSTAGQRLLIKDIVPYENFPPLHPHCDCTVIILGKDGGVERVLDSEGRFIDEETGDLLEYAKATLKKAVLGDFSNEEYTPEALALSVIAGTLGADLPMDVRDLAASIIDVSQNGFNEERRNTLIVNTLAVLPVAGGVKYVKKIPSVEKHIDEVIEAVADAVKHGDEVVEVVDSLKPQNLVEELAKSGVKYTPDEVVAITKMADGKLVWLETGNDKAGLKHIMQHSDQFTTKGIPHDKIPDFIIHAVKSGKVVGMQRTRTIYEVMYENKLQRVAISIGDNGFIVGANPKSIS